MAQTPSEKPQSPLEQLTQPFIDLIHAPRALWGINLAYFLEGWVYFGMLGYLAMHFSDFIFRGVPDADVHSHHMVMILTAGITISMFFLGQVADKFGVRKTLLLAFVFLIVGRVIISAAPLFFEPDGLDSPLQFMTMGGILFVVIGYGMYQPAAYAGVRKFTGPKTAAMGFAMLYALMNLGGMLPMGSFLLRDTLGLGITGTYWFYTILTGVALFSTYTILTKRVAREAADRAEQERAANAAAEKGESGVAEAPVVDEKPAVKVDRSLMERLVHYITHHPFRDLRFTFFIFALIPVQTLFTYNWLILPQYINRSYTGWIGEKFEVASNFNPLLIFIAVPIITALTQKNDVYRMMILGTFIMGAPAFLLAVGTNGWLLFGYLVIMTIGEAMWQPRFLQYAAEIAPEGRTGEYMGVAQLPWFLTKMLVPFYSGHMLSRYVPAEGEINPQGMWLIFSLIAISTTVLLVIAKGWVTKDFKTKA